MKNIKPQPPETPGPRIHLKDKDGVDVSTNVPVTTVPKTVEGEKQEAIKIYMRPGKNAPIIHPEEVPRTPDAQTKIQGQPIETKSEPTGKKETVRVTLRARRDETGKPLNSTPITE